jgi:hypothetical protein
LLVRGFRRRDKVGRLNPAARTVPEHERSARLVDGVEISLRRSMWGLDLEHARRSLSARGADSPRRNGAWKRAPHGLGNRLAQCLHGWQRGGGFPGKPFDDQQDDGQVALDRLQHEDDEAEPHRGEGDQHHSKRRHGHQCSTARHDRPGERNDGPLLPSRPRRRFESKQPAN